MNGNECTNNDEAKKTFTMYAENTSKESKCESCSNLTYKDGIMTCSKISNN